MEIKTKKELKEILAYEKELNIGHLSKKDMLLYKIKGHPYSKTWKYIRLLRIAGYYNSNRKKNKLKYIGYLIACRRKNILGRKLGIELGECSFDKGLILYHTVGTVVNAESRIGKNCKLHGNNCIGNSGLDKKCPVLGDNIRVGVGAKIIGDVRIADGITVAAGAVVVDSFTEPGIVVGGGSRQKNQVMACTCFYPV